MDTKTTAAMARHYAREAHKNYLAKLNRLKEVLDERPMEADDRHLSDFLEARSLYSIYTEALALDAVGTTAFNDDKLLDRLADARVSQQRHLLLGKADNAGLFGLVQRINENATRRFLTDTAFVKEGP